MEISTTTANENPRTRLEIVSPNFSKSINFKFPDAPAQPIQLVAFEEGKGFYVTKEAEKFFEAYENTKLGVITIIGKSRTGKSYLLNRVLLNRENGFHVGHTINPCTRGICLWPNEIEIENYNNEGEKLKVFVLDTEGLGATDQDEEFDTKLFIIALLLSSYMIYNSVGTIDEKAINSLSLIINISKHLQKSNEKDFENIINCFPTFLWVLRDFSLKLVDPSGNPITPRDYLENSLKPQKGLSEAAENKNRIRRLISEFFKDRDCFMLVRPTEQEKDIQNLHQLDPSKLRKEFNEHISLLRKKIYSKVRPKMFKGKFVTGRTFLTLGKMFCKAINEGNVMSVSSSWENICKLENSRITRNLEEVYEEEMMSEIKEKALSKEDLKRTHLRVKEKIFKELQKKRFGDDISAAEEELNKNVQDKFKLLRKRNQANIEENLRSQIEEQYLAKQIEVDTTDPKSVANAIETISELVLTLQNDFTGEGHKATIYEYFHEKLKNLCYGIANEGITKFSQKEKFLEEKLKSVQETHTNMKADYERKIEEYQETIKNVEKEKINLHSNCKSLERELKELEAEKDNSKNANDKLVKELKKTIAQTHNMHEKETESLNKKIAYLEKENQQKAAEIEKLEALASQNQELQSAQSEDYNKTITNLMKELNALKNEHSKLQEANEELKTEISKVTEENNSLKESGMRAAVEDGLGRAPTSKMASRRGSASMELKSQYGAPDTLFEGERSKYEEKIASLEKRISELEASDAALIQTNRNLSSILERSDTRCFELEKKNEQLKGIHKVFKNVSMLCCKNCGNFYNNSVFSSHLENCLKQLEKTESKEINKENKEDNKGAIQESKGVAVPENKENKGIVPQKKATPIGPVVEEVPKKSKLIPEFRVQPRESREGYPNKGEFKIFIEYLGKDWHIIRNLKEIKAFIEEVMKDFKDWKSHDLLNELLDLNIPKEGIFTAKSVEKICGLIKDVLVAVSRDTDVRDSQKFNRFVGLGNVKRESLLPAGTGTGSRKMMAPLGGKQLFRRKINREESSEGRSFHDSKLSELDENAQEDC